MSQLQSPQWKPIYHQEILFPSDQMVRNIFAPGELSIEDQKQARLGSEDQHKINYFEPNNEVLNLRKKRNPFLYDFFPIEELIPPKQKKH